jgi:D-aminoacyl-tRNA deacylase
MFSTLKRSPRLQPIPTIISFMQTFFSVHSVLNVEGSLMILIVSSKKDPASLNIREQILTHYRFNEAKEKYQENAVYAYRNNGKDVKLICLSQESVYAQDLTTHFPSAELIVFISRHSSTSGTPTLSVHTPGNLGLAQLGGIARKVSVSPANAMRDALKVLAKLRQDMQLEYQVSYEGTHHGPSLNVPTMFAELGSSPKQWSDAAAAEAVAHATMEAVSRFSSFSAEAVLGIGGPHYNHKFTRMALENEVAFGHIIPKHSVEQLDDEMLQQCIEKTVEKVERAVLEWKGISGKDKPRVIETLKETDLQIQKV